ncbi:MAG: tetratricopeptide repeat protein [Phycisphaerales bacterium]|jgi:predicted O-linked N-acetylglucosamine transferase (SPINDLY family)
MVQSQSKQVEQPSHHIETKRSRLETLVLKDGNLHLLKSGTELPQSLIEANNAATTGRPKDATELLDGRAKEEACRIIERDPSRTDMMLILAMVFKRTGQLSSAKEWLEKILNQEPHALVYNELGFVYQRMGHLSKAIECQRKAREQEPNHAELVSNLAIMLIGAGQIQDGINLLREAIEIDPANAAIHSKLLFYLHHQPTLDPNELFEEHKRWGQVHAPANLAGTSHDNNPDPDRRLRVGYISPDFRVHPVTHFFEPLLDGHNNDEVEVYGYSDVAHPDVATERLKSKFDCYRNIRGLGDKKVIDMICQDEIDILVELSGHTAENRLLVMAHKPAPVQVTYLGSPDTTGLEQIDYRFTDTLADPPESRKFYTEELFFLPEGFLCYKPFEFSPPVTSLPAYRNDYITFGSFNAISKVHPHVIEFWAKVLRVNPNSRILLKFGIGIDQQMRKSYFDKFGELGISSDRIAIYGWKDIKEHLQLYGEVDIVLDTFPCNGFTTTCEALWMGVPVVSLVGDCHASRVGLSILSSLGLDLFTALSPDEYVTKTTALASNRQSLAQLRSTMRQRMEDSPLCDSEGFARKVEAAYRKMWHRWLESI